MISVISLLNLLALTCADKITDLSKMDKNATNLSDSSSDSSDSENETSPPEKAKRTQLEVSSSSSSSSSESEEEKEKEIVKQHTEEKRPDPPQSSYASKEKSTASHSSRESTAAGGNFSNIVINHYNDLDSWKQQQASRIKYLRKFHNWIKGVLIAEYLEQVREGNKPIVALDLCCGKGGDLPKWHRAKVDHLVCTDIAEVALDECRSRYSKYDTFTAEFITADSSRERLRDRYSNPNITFDLVSCQFAFHYSFESVEQADRMMFNAADRLKPGGIFVMTIPNAYEMVARARRSNTGRSFGNKLYTVSFDDDLDHLPLFRARYHFQLDGVVNCPEFLVYWPVLMDIAMRHGLMIIRRSTFARFCEDSIKKPEFNEMRQYLSTFMRYTDRVRPQFADDDYDHAKKHMKQNNVSSVQTLSKSEWEASTLYQVLAFKKRR